MSHIVQDLKQVRQFVSNALESGMFSDALEEGNKVYDAIERVSTELHPELGNASILFEIDATELFDDGEGNSSVNWHYCVAHATFSHQAACEFILHIGTSEGEDAYWPHKLEEMRSYGCTKEFIAAYLKAKDMGATRVLFYV